MTQSLYEQLVMQTQMNYSQYYGVYASGKTPVKLTERQPLPYDQQIKVFTEKVKEADHIIVGGASGLSAAVMIFTMRQPRPTSRPLSVSMKSIISPAPLPGCSIAGVAGENFGVTWRPTLHAPIREPYKDLQAILRDKDYFILTTNQDTQAIKAFLEEKVAQIQGDHRFFQCSQQCTDDVWDATEKIDEMYDYLEEHDTTTIPDAMIPRCPHCGAEAFPWVRGYGNFLEGSRYQEQYQKISDDLEHHLHDQHLLFLELGVGQMTPMFIQEPFWALTNNLPGAYDVMVNRDYQFLPQQIEDKGVAIKGDIAKALRMYANN